MTDAIHCRNATRRAVDLRCVATLEQGHRLFGQRAIDLSPEGALVETRIPVPEGAPVMLTLRLGRHGAVHARGKVTRIVSNRRPGDRGCAVAVRFEGLTDYTQAVLARALRGIPPTIPQRALRIRSAPVQLPRAA